MPRPTKPPASGKVAGAASFLEGERGASDAAGGLREEVSAYKRDLIVRAAIETFFEHGYHNATVDLLTSRLSGSKAIFYYHFPDKRAVLDEIYRRAMSSALQVLDKTVAAGGTPPEMLDRFARRYTEWVLGHQKLVDVFRREERTISAEMRAEVAYDQKRWDDGIAAIIRQGIASGDFADSDPKATSRAISGMITWLYTWWRDGRRMSRAEAIEQFAQLALRMAGTRA